SFQYFPHLKEAGWEVEVKPFFDETYLKDFYRGKRNIPAVLNAYWKRFWLIFKLKKYHSIVIEKELFPYFPAWFERILKTRGISYIVDYDDAIFHNYDQNPKGFIRKLLGNKIAQVMRHSTCVVAGNEY